MGARRAAVLAVAAAGLLVAAAPGALAGPTDPPTPTTTIVGSPRAPSSATTSTTTTAVPGAASGPTVHAADDGGPTVDWVQGDQSVVVPGQTVNWTTSLSNQTGDDIAAPSVEIDVPAGLDVSGPVSAADWSCDDTGTTGPTAITCSDSQPWAAGAQLTITVPTVAASAVGDATVQVTAQPGGASGSANVTIVAPTTARIAANVSPDATPQSGGQVTITDAVTFGPPDARYAGLNVNYPTDGMTVDSASADQGFTCTTNPGNVNCNGDPVPGGTTVTLTVVATVTAPDGTPLSINLNGGGANVPNGVSTNINLLVGGVTLSGRVTVNDQPYSATGLAGICVNASPYDNGGPSSGWATTDSTGDFQLAVPPNATYRVQYSDCNQPPVYAQLYYNNTVDWNSATPVVVTTTAITGLDARLSTGHVISGTVVDENNQPVANVQVSIQDPTTGNWIAGGTTGPDGTWTTWSPVLPGSYVVQFQPPTPALSEQWWDDQPSPDTATPLVLGDGTAPVTGIDAQLAPAVSISGTVGTDGQGVGGLCVSAYQGTNPLGNDNPVASTQSAADGTYTIGGLPAGAAIRILARDCRPDGTLGYGFYTPSGPVPTFAAGTPLTGGATGVDVFLTTGATVSGTVTDAQTGQPLGQMCAAVIDLDAGFPVYEQPINPDGSYTLTGLAPGTYYAAAGDCGGNTMPLEWYDGSYGIPFNKNGPIDPVADHARSFVVASGAHVTGIDFRLGTRPDPSISFADAQLTTRGAASVTFTIVRPDGDPSIPATVQYATQDGGAVSADATSSRDALAALGGADYTPAAGTLSFAPYQTSQTVTVQLTPAGMADLGGQFSLVLSDPSAGTIGTGVATATITAAPASGAQATSGGGAGATLAMTGVDVAALTFLGLALLGVGAVLAVATRRARSVTAHPR